MERWSEHADLLVGAERGGARPIASSGGQSGNRMIGQRVAFCSRGAGRPGCIGGIDGVDQRQCEAGHGGRFAA